MLVVDDGSPDGTADLAEAAGAEVGPGVRCCAARTRPVSGSAYRAGFERGLEPRVTTCWWRWTPTCRTTPPTSPGLLQAVADGADAGHRLALRARWLARRTGPCTGCCCRGGATATSASCSGSGCATPPPGSGPTAPRCSRPSTTRPPSADGYAFQVEMAYRVRQAGGSDRRGADHLLRPRSGHVEDVDAHRRRGDAPRHVVGASATACCAAAAH